MEQIEKNAGQYIQTDFLYDLIQNIIIEYFYKRSMQKEYVYKILHVCISLSRTQQQQQTEKNDRRNSSSMTYICIQYVCDDANKATSRFSGT